MLATRARTDLTLTERSFDAALATLRSNGGRLTPGKTDILRTLHAARRPLNADEVHEQVSHVDKATVYRTRSQFEAFGIVSHRHLAHGPATYRWADVETIPVVCNSCGATVELNANEYRSLDGLVRNHHMTLLPGHFALTALCDDCAS